MLKTIVSLASAYGDVVGLFGNMAKSAPDEIQGDVEKVHELLQSQLDGAGDVVSNPLGALAQGFVSAITSVGAFARTDAYTVDHCGEHMFSVSPQ